MGGIHGFNRVRRISGSFMFVALLLSTYVAGMAAAQTVEWTRQFGSTGGEIARGIGVDAAGNVYVAGDTNGTFPGQTSAGGVDGWVRKYDANGTVLWTRQFGTSGNDLVGAFSGGIAVAPDGIYIGGFTNGAFPGAINAGGFDAFLRKYGADGTVLWTRQFGTPGFDDIHDVAVDRDKGVYVAGSAIGQLPGQTWAGGSDAYVRRYDPDGTVVWTRQFGTPAFEHFSAIAFDSTGVYAVGHTNAALPGQTSAGGFDAFVQRYTRDGDLEWTRQFGTTGFDIAWSVAADQGGVYVVGGVEGALPGQTFAGVRDAFVRKLNPGGQEMWTRQFGTSGFDQAIGVSARGLEVVVSGAVEGTLPGQTHASGPRDAFARKYGTLFGNEVWTHQFGTTGFDNGADAFLSTGDVVYVCGLTDGTFPGETNSGDGDAYLRKLVGN